MKIRNAALPSYQLANKYKMFILFYFSKCLFLLQVTKMFLQF